MLQALIDVTLELAPWLLLGTVIAALMHGLLPAGFVRRHLGGRSGGRGGLSAVTKAVAVGVPLPLCSCGVIPAGLGLRKDGASRGASVGFLISTPQTGVDSVLVSASMLGWPFALFKVLTAGVLGVFGGWLTDATAAPGDDAVPGDVADAANVDAPAEPPRRSAHDMVAHGVDVLRSIWKWLVFGVLVSALITTYVPRDAFTGLSGGGELLLFVGVLLVSLPLYVCATASVPIAAALVGAGMPLGGALVFLMAGPATNVATIGSVHRALGTRALATYLAVIVVGSVAAALGFEALVTYAPDWAAFASGAHGAHGAHAAHGAHGGHGEHAHDGPIFIASAIVLCALLLFFVWEELRAVLGTRFARSASTAGGGSADVGASAAVGDSASQQLTHVQMAVDGMTCGGCAKKLQRALLAGEGVQRADVDHDPGQIDVDVLAPDAATAREALAAIVRATGYTPHPNAGNAGSGIHT